MPLIWRACVLCCDDTTAGEGVYELIKHDRGTTLATVLELPEALGSCFVLVAGASV